MHQVLMNWFLGGGENVDKKIILVLIISILLILNEIFTALELKWYIQLAPFAIAILGYLFIEMRSRIK